MEQTPLFQVNLILWLTIDSEQTVEKQLFKADGFQLQSIGLKVDTTPNIISKVSDRGILVKKNASPDLVLFRKSDNKILLVECKLQSFGPINSKNENKDPTCQCYSLLCIEANKLARLLMLPEKEIYSAHLMYAVGENRQIKMGDTLEVLKNNLSSIGIGSNSASSIGISCKDDGIYIYPNSDLADPLTSLNGTSQNGVKVISLEKDDEPAFLYLILWDPDIGDPTPLEKQIYNNRVYTTFIAWLGQNLAVGECKITLDEILRQATSVWDLWDTSAKAAIKGELRKALNPTLKKLREKGLYIEFHGSSEIKANFPDKTVVSKIRTFLQKKTIKKGGELNNGSFQIEIPWRIE